MTQLPETLAPTTTQHFFMKRPHTYLSGYTASHPITHQYSYAGFEVLAPVVMKSSLFWNIMPCIVSRSFLLGLLFDPED
jgi:hypothetical protein